jgi:hypothetical protein
MFGVFPSNGRVSLEDALDDVRSQVILQTVGAVSLKINQFYCIFCPNVKILKRETKTIKIQ